MPEAPSDRVRSIIDTTTRHLAHRLEIVILPILEERYTDPDERWAALKRELRAWRERL